MFLLKQDGRLRKNETTKDGQFVLFRVIFNWLFGRCIPTVYPNVGRLLRSDNQTMQRRDDAAMPIAGKGSYCLDAY